MNREAQHSPQANGHASRSQPALALSPSLASNEGTDRKQHRTDHRRYADEQYEDHDVRTVASKQ